EYLEVADILEQERLWRFLIQHESQHCEIVRMVLELVNSQQSTVHSQQSIVHSHVGEMVHIPAGEFEVGNNSMDALDNERPAHRIYLDSYWIDRYPVTCGEYQVFIEAGGYQNPEWWSVKGWQWLQTEQVTQPLYWNSDRLRRGVAHRTSNNHPVYGVSWYEAEAYSRFVGKRLPTEAEWEKAASWETKANRRRIYPWGEDTPTPQHCNYDGFKTTPVNAYPQGQSAYGLYDTLGNVWEWTASWFDGYQGFASYPYKGYSQVYFDQKHRVLKGGSWASRPWVLRSSFRNWYYPQVRQIFAGFRCVRD
ncbi:SUMF1/EgtB/PvdO family nonheme iron enzyme, partial [Nostoc sp. NIES-2111]